MIQYKYIMHEATDAKGISFRLRDGKMQWWWVEMAIWTDCDTKPSRLFDDVLLEYDDTWCEPEHGMEE